MTENFRIALKALRANKLRASLTMLGIMIGVAAVITLLAIGEGVTRFVADQFIGLGTNLVFVLPSDDPDRVGRTLTMDDAEALADASRVPNVAAMAPLVFRSDELQFRGSSAPTTVRATTPDYGPLRGYEVARGRFMDEADFDGRSRVVVLGSDAVENLYPPDVDPVGTDVKIRGLNFRVVGILEPKGGGMFGSQDDL
ncbi:MAG: ABC transporter permease, partial [Anaerolineae bacterium]